MDLRLGKLLGSTLVLEKDGNNTLDTKHGWRPNMELCLSALLYGNLIVIRSLP